MLRCPAPSGIPEDGLGLDSTSRPGHSGLFVVGDVVPVFEHYQVGRTAG